MNESSKMIYDAGKRSIAATYVLWFFFGWLGVHRFYAGYKLSGLLMLAFACFGWYRFLFVPTGGLLALIFLSIWVLVDAALIPSMVRKSNIKSAQALMT